MKRAWPSFLLALLFPTFASAATRVSSSTACPSADAISQRLLGLVAAGGPTSAAARVRAEGDVLHIVLSTPGEADQDRIVPASGDCEARAELAALVIAAWLDVMPVGALSAPGVPPRAPVRATANSTAAGDSDDPDVQRARVSTRVLLGAAAMVSADELGGSGAVGIVGGMPRLIERIGWMAEISVGLPRQMALGQGTVHFWRPTFALALDGELSFSGWRLRPQGGLALGVLSISGTDFVTNYTTSTVTWGGTAGVTLARLWASQEIWVRLDGITWPQGRVARARQIPTSSYLEAAFPSWELRLALGVSLGVD